MILQNKKFVDLFAGIGGFHQALSQFGAQCVFASEWDKHAQATYQENYGMMPVGDITQIEAKDVPCHDILCAGFPCQAFSIAGKRQGFEDTRGTLFFDVARIADFHKPDVLFLENVKNFARHDEGRTLQTVLGVLADLGYQSFYQVLNASDFGLPQNRERIYIMALKTATFGKVKFCFPQAEATKTALRDILQPNANAKIVERSDLVIQKNYQPTLDKNGAPILPNRPIQIGIVNKGGQGERIYHPLGHAITLSAHGGGAGAKTGLYQIDGQVRKLSPRECARLQGFPETFKIVSSPSQAYKQFGNSVAIKVLVAILRQLEKLSI